MSSVGVNGRAASRQDLEHLSLEAAVQFDRLRQGLGHDQSVIAALEERLRGSSDPSSSSEASYLCYSPRALNSLLTKSG